MPSPFDRFIALDKQPAALKLSSRSAAVLQPAPCVLHLDSAGHQSTSNVFGGHKTHILLSVCSSCLDIRTRLGRIQQFINLAIFTLLQMKVQEVTAYIVDSN